MQRLLLGFLRQLMKISKCGQTKGSLAGCTGTDSPICNNFAEVVRRYTQKNRACLRKLLNFYSEQPTLREAITKASRAEVVGGKKHRHQWRIRKTALHQVERVLLGTRFEGVHSFQELIGLVESLIKDIWGIGELMIYDTAQRIGAKLGLEPEAIYLHAGTRVAASALGTPPCRKTISIDDVPVEFSCLTHSEIEDCFCIYKDTIKRIQRQRERIR